MMTIQTILNNLKNTFTNINFKVIYCLAILLVCYFFISQYGYDVVSIPAQSFVDTVAKLAFPKEITLTNIVMFLQNNITRHEFLYQEDFQDKTFFVCSVYSRVIEFVMFLLRAAVQILFVIYIYQTLVLVRKKNATQENTGFRIQHLIFPLLLSFYPVLSLYILNYKEIILIDVALVLFASAVIISALFFIFKFLFKDSCLSSVFVMLVLCYVYLCGVAFPHWHYINMFLYSYSFVFAVLFLLIVQLKGQKIIFDISKVFIIVLLLFVAFDLSKIVVEYGQKVFTKSTERKAAKMLAQRKMHSSLSTPKNDVYVIVLDSYPREDVLKESLGFDNGYFINSLKQKGFYVFDEAYSNYTKTYSSLPSFLNFDYFHNIDFDEHSSTKIMDSEFFNTAFDLGYEITFLNQGGVVDDKKHNIKNVVNFVDTHNAFKILVVNKTIFKQCFKFILAKDAAKAVEDAFMLTSRAVRQNSSPKLVFLHVLAPHFPYVLDSVGEPVIDDDKKLDISLGYSEYKINKPSCVEYLKYTNNKVSGLVDDILANAKNPPVIVLIGDHGVRLHYYFKNEPQKQVEIFAEKDTMKAHHSILLAIYKPNKDYARYKDNNTLLNFFIELSNDVFKTDLAQKAKRFYYNYMSQHGDLIEEIMENTVDITDKFSQYK